MRDLPKSVRQIGKISGKRKIYLEDYVYSYIRELAKQDEKEWAAVLLGHRENNRNEKFIFVSGMVIIPDFQKEGEPELKDTTWDQIYSDMKECYTNLEILGWCYSKPGMAMTCDEKLRRIHGKNFPGEDRLLMLYEPTEEEEMIFRYDHGIMLCQEGFYIYYEKNNEMREYMIRTRKREVRESVPDDTVNHIRQTLQEKADNSPQTLDAKNKTNHGLALAVAALAVVLGIMAFRNENVLETIQSKLNGVTTQESTPPPKTEVETLSSGITQSSVAVSSPGAVAVVPIS